MKLPRPERRDGPAAFYRDYLPRLWRELGGGAAFPGWRFDLAFEVDGATHALRFAAGTLSAVDTAVAPLVTMTCDEAAWRLGSLELLPQILRRVEPHLPRAHAAIGEFAAGKAAAIDFARLRAMPGAIVVDYTDDAGDSGRYRFAIGEGRGPEARVRASDADLWPLLSARGRLSDVLKSRLQVDGDVGYLLRLARVLE